MTNIDKNKKQNTLKARLKFRDSWSKEEEERFLDQLARILILEAKDLNNYEMQSM